MSSVELWESTPRDHHPQRLAEDFSPSPASGEQAITQGRTRITHGRQLYNCWGGAGGQKSCLARSMRPALLDFCLHCFGNQVELQELLKE